MSMSKGPGIDYRSLLKDASLAIEKLKSRIERLEREKVEPIAVVGIGCRLPGGIASPDDYWQLLRAGVDATGEIPPDRWNIDDYYDPDPDAADKMYVRRGAFLEGVDRFDAAFFGISPREAAVMDPQQRLLLEVSWEALEHAGIRPDSLMGSTTGVFVGVSSTDYSHLLMRAGVHATDLYAATGTSISVAAGRLSYVLGLQGPCLSVDTACSASLVAAHLATESLRRGECGLALVAGVNLIFEPSVTAVMCRGRMLAFDGRCKTFDATADGYARGEGCGVLVLKRLSDAMSAGDRVLAVIRGSAINQDGRSSGLTAPNGPSQEAVLREALKNAGVRPDQVGYIEAHGTGTPLGDPIEMRALAAVMGEGRPADRPLIVGAVKTNIGHLEAAAGVAGLIKIVLALHHGQVPPHLNFTTPTPHIPWAELPVRVATSLQPWPEADGPAVAGISAFGFSGTNAHMIVEQAPGPAPSSIDRPRYAYALSAPTTTGLQQLVAAHAGYLAAAEGLDIGDACFTAGVGRAAFAHRAVVTGSSRTEIAGRLHGMSRTGSGPHVFTGSVPAVRKKVAFLFTGQGSQYVGMGRALFEHEPTFTATLRRCDELLRDQLPRPLLSVLYPQPGAEAEAEELLRQTQFTQPALVALQLALAATWQSWGVEPLAVAGHSVGEFAAACVAGVMTLEETMALVGERARLMQSLPAGGSMAAVFADEHQVARAIAAHAGDVAIAAINAPGNVVISGAGPAVDSILAQFGAEGIRTSRLVVSHAFHSPLMQPIVADFGATAARLVSPKPARVRLISNLTGKSLGPLDRMDADYWMRHVRQPVRFADSVQALRDLGYDLFLEIGPSPVLLGLARQCVPEASAVWVPSLKRQRDDWTQIVDAVAELWSVGVPIDWDAFDRPCRSRRVTLPTYPFERERHWLPAVVPVAPPRPPSAAHLLGERVSSPVVPQTIFQSVIDATSLDLLAEHVVYGNPIFPAMGYVELARQAARAAFRVEAPRVCDLAIEEALTVPVGERRLLQIVLAREGDGGGTFEVFSRVADDVDGVWTRHVTGRVDAAAPEPCDASLDELRRRCPRAIDASAFYAQIAERGLAYGPAFRAIELLWAGDGESLARLAVSSGVDARGYDAHPGSLDAALQVLGALFSDSGLPGGDMFLPVAIPALAIAAPVPAAVYSYARLHAPLDIKADLVKADVFWIDDAGRTILSAPGIVMKRASGAAVRRAAEKRVQSWMYEIGWQPAPPVGESAVPSPSSWIVVGDSDGDGGRLVRTLTAQGHDAVLLEVRSKETALQPQLERLLLPGADARARGVVYIAADRSSQDASQSQDRLARLLVGDALAIVQAAARATPQSPRLVFVTRGAQAAGAAPYDVAPAEAAVWGFARSVRVEHPELACATIDLDPSGVRDDGPALANELTSPDGEDQIAYRAGARLAARLVQAGDRVATTGALPVPDAPSFGLSTTARGVLDNLILEPRERRRPASGEVEIEVEAAGVNFRDVLNALGMYPGDPGPMGGECAGKVVAVGPGVTRLQAGDEVFCLAGAAFSRFVVAQERAVARRPSTLSAVQAASLPLTFLTVYHGLHHLASIKAGDRVLVHAAAGGVGLSAIQVARAAGAEVYGTAGSAEKQDYVRRLGVRAVFSSRISDFEAGLMEATGGQGVDIVLNSLTGEFIPASLRVLRPGGTFLEIGKAEIWSADQVAAVNPNVRYTPFDLGEVMLTDLDLIETMFQALLAGLGAGTLAPLPVRAFDLTDARSAFRFMAQARHFGKIVLRMPRPPSRVVAGAYIVTGGTGGLGVRVAQHLAERGVRHLILAARSEPGAAALSAADALRAAGTRVEVVRADVGTADGVARLLAAVDAAGVPLSGVVHAAGVLDDGVIREQTPDRFERVMSPKVDGAWLLDRMTRGRGLEQFVMFSSVASLLGSPGQANYAAANGFLDGLAHRRHARGEPATSINWGPWADIGMAARLGGRSSGRLDDTGFGTIAADFGLVALDLATSADIAQVGVFPAKWDRIVGRFAAGAEPAFLRTLAAEVRSRSPQSDGQSSTGIRQLLSESADPRATMISFLRRHVAAALGLSNPERLDVAAPLTNAGLDSLMALELRNRLSSELALTLAPTLLFEFPTIETVADHLNTLLRLGPTPAASDTDTDSSVDAMTDEQVDTMLARLLEESQGKR